MPGDPYKYFRVEARDLLDQLGREVLALERGPVAPEAVGRLLRLAHTLKGAARIVKAREIADRAHAIEEALGPFREGAASLPRDRVEAVLGWLDEIAVRTAALAPAPKPEGEGAPGAFEQTPRIVRAEPAELDALLAGVTEAYVELASLGRTRLPVERALRLAELLDEQLASPRRQRPAGGGAATVRSMTAELRRLLGEVERQFAGGMERIGRELREVRGAAERLRLVPAGTLFGSLERVGRDAAQSLGKRVRFLAGGGDVRLDAHVLSVVQGALVQAVRNAIAHGIEAEADRRSAGKEAEGRVSVLVRRRGGRVVFECRDDGRGVDFEAVRRAAERKGIPPAEARTLEGEELLRLLLQGGLTTAGTATELAGRGIGLDVVREAADRLGGEVRVRTERGQGTTLELVVPATLSSVDALVVEAAGRTAAIPLEAVRRTIRLAPGDLGRTADRRSLPVGESVLPFLSLARALRADDGAPGETRDGAAVVVEGASGTCAVGVERIRGVEAIVVRPLPELTPAAAVVAGASLDVEGIPRLVLDPDGLLEEARSGTAPPVRPAPPKVPILVVDDSLTTRMLEQSILEAAGYEVDLAASGEEALELARRRRYGLFLVDVEMPGLDGFEFIERTRADPDLRDVPAVLVTSRSSPEDRRRGERVGAVAYVVKSEFDQADLLGRIRRLVGSR